MQSTRDLGRFAGYVRRNDINNIRRMLNEGLNISKFIIVTTFKSFNIEIVRLILSYQPVLDKNTVIDLLKSIDNIDIINELLKYLFNYDSTKLDFTIDEITEIISDSESFYDYSQEKKDLLNSLIFKHCVDSQIEDLKDKLKLFNVVSINGVPIDNYNKSTKELCNIIKTKYKIDINKFDDGYKIELAQGNFMTRIDEEPTNGNFMMRIDDEPTNGNFMMRIDDEPTNGNFMMRIDDEPAKGNFMTLPD